MISNPGSKKETSPRTRTANDQVRHFFLGRRTSQDETVEVRNCLAAHLELSNNARLIALPGAAAEFPPTKLEETVSP